FSARVVETIPSGIPRRGEWRPLHSGSSGGDLSKIVRCRLPRGRGLCFRPLGENVSLQIPGRLGKREAKAMKKCGSMHAHGSWHISRRQFGRGAAAVLAATATGSLVRGAAAAEAKPGGTLVAGFSADPAGFDPQRGPSGMSHVVIEQVYSTLMALDPDAKPYPELAESFDMSADGLTYTFKLHQGVRFHNGDELTADDVKFSFDRLRAKDSGYSYGSQVETIASVDAVDKYTAQFKLSKRTGPFL